MPAGTVEVRGLREFQRAIAKAPPDTRKAVREEFKEVGEDVRQDALQRFSRVSARSAAGYRVQVSQRGVFVVQSLRKTTGRRPDYGRLQMRKALLPALLANESNLERKLEDALDKIADRIEG